MDILIFKTDVGTKRKVNKVRALLAAVKAVDQWSVDLEDCDNVLRVVATELSPGFIELLLKNAGYNCQEMDY